MAEYSRLARGSFTTAATVLAQVVNLPFQPTQVTLTCPTSYTSPTQYDTTRAYWDVSMGQGVANQEYISAASFPWNTAADYVASGGISTFSAGIALQYGPSLSITAMTLSGTQPQVTTSAPHGLVVGDVVVFQNLYQTASTGQIQICGMPFVVTVVGSTTTFKINYNNNVTGFTALSASPAFGSSCKQVLYPNLYAPSVGFVAGLTFGVGPLGTGSGNYTLLTLTAPANFQVGQEIALRIPANYGSTQLNSLPDLLIPGSPTYYYVTYAVPSTFGLQFVLNTAGTGVTAFTTSVLFATAQAGGLTFPQAVAVGDNNSGSNQFGYGSPQFYNGFANSVASSINGPAIVGAFCNNTSQGFIVGLGSGAAATTAMASAPLLTASSLYFWEALLFDIG